MAEKILIAMLAALVVWVGAVAYASSRLVWANWPLFASWRRQDRETRLRMALWVSIPLMKISILSFAAHGLWGLAAGHHASDLMLIRALIVTPMVLTAAALMLWWIANRVRGAERGDRLWCQLMWAGVALGALMLGGSFWF